MAEKLKVITPQNLGKGIVFNPETKKWEVNVETGLTCASIDQLPTKPWKKGTTLLAKQDGECIKLTALDSIFQEIGVGIAADKTSAFTGEEYRVVVTVSNTGEGKNDLTNLVVQKPLLGNYNIKDVTTSHQGLDSFDRKNDLAYDLKGLAKGGTFILRFTVVANDIGTFQFSASVNPNSALDQEQKNNTATITLSANSKVDTTYVPSVDCPRITATELDSNVVLQQLSSSGRSTIDSRSRITYDTSNIKRSNIFANRRTLKGLRIRLDGASTVVGYKRTNSTGIAAVLSNNTTTDFRTVEADYGSAIIGDHDYPKSGTDGYTFNNGVLEITEDIKLFAFSCRAQGKNCRWQNYLVLAVLPVTSFNIITSDVVGASTRIEKKWSHEIEFSQLSQRDIGQMQVIPSSIKANTKIGVGFDGAKNAFTRDKLIVTVKAGTAASLNFISTGNYATAEVRGKTTITGNRITVAANAKSTDSVNTEFIQVIVED